jgi:hypothetical protein
MKALCTVAIAAGTLASVPALSQAPESGGEGAFYVTCREAQAMAPDARIRFVLGLVERAAQHYGVIVAEGTPLADEVATMLRAGCTTFPDAFVQTVTSVAVRRATQVTPPTVVPDLSLPFAQAVFISCGQYAALSDAQQDAVEFTLAQHAGQRYGLKFETTPAARAKFDDGITPLVHGTCRLLPELPVHTIVARAVHAEADMLRRRQ